MGAVVVSRGIKQRTVTHDNMCHPVRRHRQQVTAGDSLLNEAHATSGSAFGSTRASGDATAFGHGKRNLAGCRDRKMEDGCAIDRPRVN